MKKLYYWLSNMEGEEFWALNAAISFILTFIILAGYFLYKDLLMSEVMLYGLTAMFVIFPCIVGLIASICYIFVTIVKGFANGHK